MASLSRKQNGLLVIEFVRPDGKRKWIRLGRHNLEFGREVTGRVAELVDVRTLGGSLGRDLAAWLRGIEPALRDKLAAAGLVERQERLTLGAFVDAYIARGRREDGKPAKPATLTVWKRSRRHLVTFFGPDKTLESITFGDVKDFVSFLHTAQTDAVGNVTRKALGDETARRTCGHAYQFLQDAVDRELLTSNPFRHADRATGAGDGSRQQFITRETAQKVIDALPDAEWRLLFALSRYGGLRCPSEHLQLRWSDVDFPGGRMIVRSPKTEHHQGKGVRVVPLFPELRPYLEDVERLAPERSEFVITRYRSANKNLRTALLRYIDRAGVEPWPKLFNNLRSSRQTELEEEFPSHVVCAWIGNSEKIARKHYLQVTADHFARALRAGGRAGEGPEIGGKSRETEGSEVYKSSGKSADSRTGAQIANGRGGTRTPDLMGVIHAF